MGVVGRVCVCIGLGGALVLSFFVIGSPVSAQSALLDALSTRVTLEHPGGVADEVAVERVIRSGDTVATDRTGHAVVTYPDGSTALLEESSELTIEFVRTTAGDYVVRMQQTLGRVWYAVTRTVASGGRYEVRSAAMASVIRADEPVRASALHAPSATPRDHDGEGHENPGAERDAGAKRADREREIGTARGEADGQRSCHSDGGAVAEHLLDDETDRGAAAR